MQLYQLLAPKLSYRRGKKVVTVTFCGIDSCSTRLHSVFLHEVSPCTVGEASQEVTLSIHTVGLRFQEQAELDQPTYLQIKTLHTEHRIIIPRFFG